MYSLFIIFKKPGMQMVDTRPQKVLNLLRKTHTLQSLLQSAKTRLRRSS